MDDLDRSLAADLNEFVVGEPPDIDHEPEPPPDTDSANRLLRRLSRLNDEADKITRLAEAEIQRIRDWQADRMAGITRQRSWITRSLEGFTRQWHYQTGGKTLSLPNGELMLRDARARVVIEAETDVVAWAMEKPTRRAVLRFRPPEVDKSAVAKLSQSSAIKQGTELVRRVMVAGEDGALEVVPGVTVVRDTTPTFHVKGKS